jgi:hypothetical protein
VKKLFLPVFVVAAALAIVACGSSESDEDKITSLIETSATSTDPADCTKLTTQNFMEQGSGAEGKEAVEDCEKEAEEGKGNPESVDVEGVEVEGEEATATVAFHGGGLDGQTLVVNVVEEEGEWKVNELESFASLNRGKLTSALEEALEEEKEIEPELAECVMEGVEESSNSELEGLILNGPEGLVEIAEECSE